MRLAVLGLTALTALLSVDRVEAQATTTAGHAGMPMPAPRLAATSDSDVVALLTGTFGSKSPVGVVTRAGRTVRVAWSGDQPDRTRPWFIHKGSCGRDAGMVGAPSAYTPIVVDATGRGVGMATLADLLASDPLYVAVHDATPNSATPILACGTLSSRRPAASPTPADMSGMDHGSMSMQGAPAAPGRDSGSVTMNHDAMDHESMNHDVSATSTPDATASSTRAAMVALQRRLMSDPVIRRRIEADTTTRRLMDAAMGDVRKAMDTPSMARPMSPPAAPMRKAGAAPRRTSAARTERPASTMGGMDHGSMPGMAMPSSPKPSTTKPPTTPAKRAPRP